MSYSADEIRDHVASAIYEAQSMLEKAKAELEEVESELDNSGF
jgi:F0F1-type ATP synthase membrane subunit b/b'